MRSLPLLSVAFGLSFGGIVFVPVGCGNTTQHPPPASADREGGISDYEGGVPLRDAAREAAADASSDAADASGADGEAGPCTGSGALACACPVGMVSVSLAAGGAYCVDQAEVPNGQYSAFIQANVPVSDQIPACAGNTSFIPQANWPPPQPLTSFGVPVRDVDWCDAYAYCKWAGKALCGHIGGGSLAQGDANDATKSAWYNACSAGAANTYPYGKAFSTTTCRGNNSPLTTGEPDKNGPWFVWQYGADGTNSNNPLNVGCMGGTVKLYQMSGNLREWEDSCSGTAGGSDTCSVRGGSYLANDTAAKLACNAADPMPRLNPDPVATPQLFDDVGFRCCLY